MSSISNEIKEVWKNDRYQVFLFTCLTNVPHNFVVHPWFVVNKKSPLPSNERGNDTVSRWEIRHTRSSGPSDRGYLHKNGVPLFRGIPVYPLRGEYFWKATLRYHIEGPDGSVAHRMVERIEHSPENYPYCETYSVFGPNSNTYAQWVIGTFPGSGMTLPWNAFGKNFKK